MTYAVAFSRCVCVEGHLKCQVCYGWILNIKNTRASGFNCTWVGWSPWIWLHPAQNGKEQEDAGDEDYNGKDQSHECIFFTFVHGHDRKHQRDWAQDDSKAKQSDAGQDDTGRGQVAP